jgi:flagellar L-ring protein precursor FlgH
MKKPWWSAFETAAVLAAVAAVSGPAPLCGQSLWREDVSRSMVADKRAHSVGDILNILVQENSTATKDNNTKTAKKTGVDASLETFFYSPGASKLLTKGGRLPAMKFSAKNDFDGGGSINNSERITARIAARVIDVLPNGNLVIEGTRQSAFGGETQDMILRGTVRAEDVTAANTVFSFQVADATIRIVNKGTVTDTQRKGWFTRVWDKLTPF